jgi:hypothetical protein
MVRGTLSGLLALTALEAVLGTDAATARAGGLFAGITNGIASFLSPMAPAIRDRSHGPIPNAITGQVAGAPAVDESGNGLPGRFNTVTGANDYLLPAPRAMGQLPKPGLQKFGGTG